MAAIELDAAEVAAFLRSDLGLPATDVAYLASGAWSSCFAFVANGEQLVARFGHQRDDFERDVHVQQFSSAGLPIPQVRDTGVAFGGYYCVSTRVFGEPLEHVSTEHWLRLLPQVIDAYEALRLTTPPAGTPFGSLGVAGAPSWGEYLQRVSADPPGDRMHPWQANMTQAPQGDTMLKWAIVELEKLADISVDASLVHGDLINRNVFVSNNAIEGVFDWGCARWGDHLMELAWLQFWQPWHTNLDLAELEAGLDERWAAAGYIPERRTERMRACFLHIAIDHLKYAAFRKSWEDLTGVEKRMRAVFRDAPS